MNDNKRVDMMTETDESTMPSVFLKILGALVGLAGATFAIFQIPFLGIDWFSGIKALFAFDFGAIIFILGLTLIKDIENRFSVFACFAFGILAVSFFYLIWAQSIWYLIPFGIVVVPYLIFAMKISHCEEPIIK